MLLMPYFCKFNWISCLWALSIFIFFLMNLCSNVLIKYEHENVPLFANIVMRIFLFAIFIYFIVVVYEILKYDETLKIEDKRHFLMLGHIRYLSGIVVATLLLLILILYFEWLHLVIWIKNQYNTRDREEE